MAWPSGRAKDGGIDEIPLPAGVPGRLFLCGKHAIGPDPDDLLASVGGSTVVCLNEPSELAGRYPEFVEWLAAHEGDRARHRPIHDLHAPEVETFSALIDEVFGLVDRGDTIVVNCGAGIGRAGTVAVGVLVRAGVPIDDALETVRSHRPMAGPEVGAQSDVLREYASQRIR